MVPLGIKMAAIRLLSLSNPELYSYPYIIVVPRLGYGVFWIDLLSALFMVESYTQSLFGLVEPLIIGPQGYIRQYRDGRRCNRVPCPSGGFAR
jgi:hypothetical protein